MQHEASGMLSLPQHVYQRPHSVAWITPAGKFIVMAEGMIHDDYATRFPEFITAKEAGSLGNYIFPSNVAVDFGYAKVSNPFEILLEKPVRNDPRLRTMAEFTAGAIIEFDKTKSRPSWMEIDFEDRAFPLRWQFRLTTPGQRLTFNRMTVFAFFLKYGSNETLTLVSNHFEGRMNESLLRKLIKKLLTS